MRSKSLKISVIALVGIVLAVGAAAYAYWTVSGSGTGEASTGNVTSITVNQTGSVSGLAPGLPAQALAGTFDNPNSGPVFVTSVSAVVSGTDKANCNASDYTISGSPATVGTQVVPAPVSAPGQASPSRSTTSPAPTRTPARAPRSASPTRATDPSSTFR